MLITGAMGALNARHFAAIQKAVIKQTLAEVNAKHPGSVLLVDTTGVLGDVYTLYNPTLGDALAAYGSPTPAIICTPDPIDRDHPVARRLPLETTPRCDKAPPMKAPTLVLTAGWLDGAISVKP
jgi:hypothetical protein